MISVAFFICCSVWFAIKENLINDSSLGTAGDTTGLINNPSSKHNFEKAKEIAVWKKSILEKWDNIEVVNYHFERPEENVYHSGHDYRAEIVLDIKNIPTENVGVEFVFTLLTNDGEYEFVDSQEFKLVSCKNGKCLYRADLIPEKAGTFFYGIRIYPRHQDLPHKQDFYLLRWID